MPHKPQKYVYDMLDRAQFLLSDLDKRVRSDLDTDRWYRSAVERELQIIGEALFQLNGAYPEIAERIPFHTDIIGFRHVLVHGYTTLDYDRVWATLHEDLPELTETLSRLLDELDSKEAQS